MGEDIKVVGHWSPETVKPGSEEVHLSPCGEFKLTVRRHTTGPHTWEYSSGVVERVNPDAEWERCVTVVRRNYGSFPFCWLVREGRTHLAFGANYQGYGILDCRTGRRCDYTGDHFCHVRLSWNPAEPDTLKAYGCVWGGPGEFVVYDIGSPFSFPWPTLSREIDPREFDEEPEGECGE